MSRVKPSEFVIECFAVTAVVILAAASVNFLLDEAVRPELVAIVHGQGGQ